MGNAIPTRGLSWLLVSLDSNSVSSRMPLSSCVIASRVDRNDRIWIPVVVAKPEVQYDLIDLNLVLNKGCELTGAVRK